MYLCISNLWSSTEHRNTWSMTMVVSMADHVFKIGLLFSLIMNLIWSTSKHKLFNSVYCLWLGLQLVFDTLFIMFRFNCLPEEAPTKCFYFETNYFFLFFYFLQSLVSSLKFFYSDKDQITIGTIFIEGKFENNPHLWHVQLKGFYSMKLPTEDLIKS